MRKIFAALGTTLFVVAGMGALTAAPALAYASQGTSTCTVSGTTLTCTFKDANGVAVAGATVTFSQVSGPAGCTATFNPTTATTDANGVASTTFTLPCAGSYVLAGSTQGVTVSATAASGKTFPATSAEVPVSRGLPPWTLGALIAGVALILVGAGGLAVRRR
jgi:hypothetical protein